MSRAINAGAGKGLFSAINKIFRVSEKIKVLAANIT
jgi:hypothetical protein